jgi:hypothetical protein
MHSFCHKRSFRHNLNCASNKKGSFTKVVQFGSLSKEVRNMHSFWSQALISS